MKNDKIIIITLIIVIVILAVGIAWQMHAAQTNGKSVEVNNTTVENTTVKNATLEEEESVEQQSESGQYGYCAICGKALTYAEAHEEYTQGKVCYDCASNPYFETEEGAKYANKKLEEAYPDEY